MFTRNKANEKVINITKKRVQSLLNGFQEVKKIFVLYFSNKQKYLNYKPETLNQKQPLFINYFLNIFLSLNIIKQFIISLLFSINIIEMYL